MPVNNPVIIIFPYLFFDEKSGMEIEGLTIKPSYTEVIDKENEFTKRNLLNIARLFRYKENYNINRWSYIVTTISSKNSLATLKEKINRISQILRFLGFAGNWNRGTFLNYNFFLFELPKKQYEDTNEFAHYQGFMNLEDSFNFFLKNEKTDSPYIPNHALSPVILNRVNLENNDYYKFFYTSFVKGEELLKYLTAIEWYNRSFSHNGHGVDGSLAIVNCHTAFESLLTPENTQPGIAIQISTAFGILLGTSNEVLLWYQQFWQLRNSIVHGDVKQKSFVYTHKGGRFAHRDHLTIARKVFVMCFDRIMQSRSRNFIEPLEEELVSNEIRVKAILKGFKGRKPPTLQQLHKRGVLKAIRGLRNDDNSVRRSEIQKVGNLFLPFFSKYLSRTQHQGIVTQLIAAIDNVLKWQGTKYIDLALLYSKLDPLFSPVYFSKVVRPQSLEELELENAAYNFFEFAMSRLF